MCIPEQKNRLCALKEIHRVLKNDSIFIFTAHDREHSSKLKEYWEKKRKEYEADKKSQKDFYEFGDMWTYKDTGSAFIHFSTISEIIAVLNELNFKIISIVERGLISEEPASVKDFSGDTIFYICKITK